MAPSADVQRLLVSLARSNPEARPIPPIELDNLLKSGPSMLDLVTRMEKDNAELRKWLEKTQATHKSALPKGIADPGRQRGSKEQMSWTCNVKLETMASILCYAKPGEDLDWTKVTDRKERIRLQNIIKSCRRKMRAVNEQGQSGSGGDYPGAEGVRGFLSKSSAPKDQTLDRRIGRPRKLKRKGSDDALLNCSSSLKRKDPTVVPQAVLTTDSGLRLLDVTVVDRERLTEDVVP